MHLPNADVAIWPANALIDKSHPHIGGKYRPIPNGHLDGGAKRFEWSSPIAIAPSCRLVLEGADHHHQDSALPGSSVLRLLEIALGKHPDPVSPKP